MWRTGAPEPPRSSSRRFLEPACLPQTEKVKQVIEPVAHPQFAAAPLPRTHFVAHFQDLTETAPDHDLHQSLEAQRMKFDPGDRMAAEDITAAERIRGAGESLGQQNPAEPMGDMGIDAAMHGPIAEAATFGKAAGDDEIGLIDAAEHSHQHGGRMLEIGIDGAENLASGKLPAADYGARESPLGTPARHPKLRIAAGNSGGDFAREVGALVIHHNDLIGFAQHR